MRGVGDVSGRSECVSDSGAAIVGWSEVWPDPVTALEMLENKHQRTMRKLAFDDQEEYYRMKFMTEKYSKSFNIDYQYEYTDCTGIARTLKL
nr:hypothetical protein [Tanacetum cinerariifolium]